MPEPNPESNFFGPGFIFCFRLNQIAMAEPNLYMPEPKKAIPRAISEPKEANEPKKHIEKSVNVYRQY